MQVPFPAALRQETFLSGKTRRISRKGLSPAEEMCYNNGSK
jgi:hypothetical protein